jgi:hypothetical protein
MVDKIIEKVYNDFFGSIKDTYTDAKKVDKSITYDDVRNWFQKNSVRKTNLRGYNSFIADHAKQEFQIDLFFMNEDEEYKVGLLIIDIFSKYITVVPLKTKQPDDILQGLKDGFHNMGGYPESIYSDDEGAFNSKLIQDYFIEHKINHIITRGHAPYAERAIRTIKNLIYKRLEKNSDSNWYDVKILANALVNYNYRMINSITKMTPDNARQPKNRLDVKLQLELHRKSKRKYPEIKEGDKVRIYTKKKNFQKERIPVWSENLFTVDKIEEKNNQNFYYLNGRDRPLLRHEILLQK